MAGKRILYVPGRTFKWKEDASGNLEFGFNCGDLADGSQWEGKIADLRGNGLGSAGLFAGSYAAFSICNPSGTPDAGGTFDWRLAIAYSAAVAPEGMTGLHLGDDRSYSSGDEHHDNMILLGSHKKPASGSTTSSYLGIFDLPTPWVAAHGDNNTGSALDGTAQPAELWLVERIRVEHG